MPIYQYTALAPGGEVKKGVIDADTARDIRDAVGQMVCWLDEHLR